MKNIFKFIFLLLLVTTFGCLDCFARCKENRGYILDINNNLLKLSRTQDYIDFIYSEANNHQLDHNLLLAMVDVESDFRSRVVSYRGAVGLGQITIPVARDRLCDIKSSNEEIKKILYDPCKNIRIMISHIKWIKKHLKSQVKSNYEKVTIISAIYNAGQMLFINKHKRLPDAHEGSFIRRPEKYKEMIDYINKVKNRYFHYEKQYGKSPYNYW